jgi:hypothetical protein
MPSEVRFTRAQKWDLARISAAAVASTVFFTLPMFLVRPQPAPAENRASQPDIVLASVSEGNRHPDSRDIATSTQKDAITGKDMVAVVTTTEVPHVTTPTLQTAVSARARTRRPVDVRARADRSAAPPSFSRRLGRFLAGTGKYIVKPFPSVNSSGS